MRWKNTEERYGYTAMLLHWLLGALLIGMTAVGLYMTSLQDGDDKYALYALHKSIGIIVFALVVARILWRSNSVVPPLPSNLKRIEMELVQLTHKFLYVAMFVLPVSGYINTSAGDFKLDFFGLYNIPKVIPEDGFIEVLFLAVHTGIAYALIAFIVLHIGAAMKHHFILKDNVLRRMWPIRLK